MFDEETVTLSHETHPKVLKPHEWVQIRAEMTAADNIAIQNKLSRVTGRGKDVQIHMNLGDVALATVQRMVTGWNLTRTIKRGGQSHEEPIAFSKENVINLRKAVFELINNEINRLNAGEDEEEQEGFTSAAAEPSEASSAPKKLFPTKS